MTLYWKNGKVATTDGPYAETKEQLGGITWLRRATSIMPFSLSHSFQALSMDLDQLRRPVADISEMIKESEQRRRKDTRSASGGSD